MVPSVLAKSMTKYDPNRWAKYAAQGSTSILGSLCLSPGNLQVMTQVPVGP